MESGRGLLRSHSLFFASLVPFLFQTKTSLPLPFFPRPFKMHLKDTWYFRLLISVTSNDVGKNSPEARSKKFAGSNRGLLLPSSEIKDLPCFWKLPPVTRRRTCSEEEGLFWRRRPFPFSQPKKRKTKLPWQMPPTPLGRETL